MCIAFIKTLALDSRKLVHTHTHTNDRYVCAARENIERSAAAVVEVSGTVHSKSMHQPGPHANS